MGQSAVELRIPDEIYERARQIARERNLSLETVLLEGLALLFGELRSTDLSPDALIDYTDEQLWAIVHQRLAWPQETRLDTLMAKGKLGALSDNEQTELERFIGLVDHQMLLRSEAILLLKQRGYDVEARLKLGA